MSAIMIAGSGQIGAAIAHILSQADAGYSVIVVDQAPKPASPFWRSLQMDVTNKQQLAQTIKNYSIQSVISSLPYFLNTTIAELAKSLKLHYFDLTEDVNATAAIARLAEGAHTAFIPQCGVAPGFINIVANELMQHFRELNTVKLHCGALPQQTSNALQYALTWSIDGLINEYGNACAAIVNRQSTWLAPLTDLESVQLDGTVYEAFNTSGGLGTLMEKYAGKVNFLNYKTLRYPGHCEKMLFLMDDLHLNQDRATLKKILLNALPYTQQDVVIVHVSVQGLKNGELLQEESYFRKFYPHTLNDQPFTAIQMATASCACSVIDLVLQNPHTYRGFVHQTQFSLTEIMSNRFGKYLGDE